MGRPAFTALVLVALCVTGCEPWGGGPRGAFPKAGAYAGFFRLSSVGVAASGLDQVPVQGDLARGSRPGTLGLALKDASGRGWSAPIELRRDAKRLLVSWPLLGDAPVTLGQVERGCWSTLKGQKSGPSLRACWNDSELDVAGELPDGRRLELTLGRSQADLAPVLEDPAQLSLGEVAERAIHQSFESRVQFQRSVQSRLNAQAAYLQLLPHLSFSGLVGLSSFQPSGLVKMAGDLLPFLFPARWIRADAASHMARADEYAFGLMRADAGLVAETLGWSLLRDTDAVERLSLERDEIARLRDQVLAREKLGMVPPGSSDDLTALVDQIDAAATLLRGTVETNLTFLSQAAGYTNPLAIRALRPEQDIPVTEPLAQDLPAAQQLALARAYELRQVDELILEAQDRRKGRWVNWLDPSGEGAGALGLGLVPYIEVGASQVEELKITRQKLQEGVLRKVANAFQSMTTSARVYAIAVADSEVQQRRLDRLVNQLRLGQTVSTTELVTAVQGKLRNELDLSSARFTWASASAALDRQLYQGRYGAGRLPAAAKGQAQADHHDGRVAAAFRDFPVVQHEAGS